MLSFRAVVGLFLVLLGLGNLFHPNLILKFNALMRDVFFNDRIVLLNAKRAGLYLLAVGFFLLLLSLRAAR